MSILKLRTLRLYRIDTTVKLGKMIYVVKSCKPSKTHHNTFNTVFVEVKEN